MNLNTGAPSIHELWNGLARKANVGGPDRKGPKTALLQLEDDVKAIFMDNQMYLGYSRALVHLLDAARRAGLTIDILLLEAADRIR